MRYAGMKGGTVLNPINALAKLLAGMVDDDHHITVEGFYEWANELAAGWLNFMHAVCLNCLP